jgi:hypothetical protein
VLLSVANMAVNSIPNSSFEQFGKLVVGEASALDNPQCQPTSQIATVLRYDYATAVTGTPEHNVTARLVIDLKSRSLQGTNDLTRSHRGQTGHYAVSKVTLSRPMNCPSDESTGIASPCFNRLAQ